jgi:hypothetical protein
MKRFNLKDLNELVGKDRYPVDVSIVFAAWKIWTLGWKSLVLRPKRM